MLALYIRLYYPLDKNTEPLSFPHNRIICGFFHFDLVTRNLVLLFLLPVFLPVKRQVHKNFLVHDFRNHIRGCRAVLQQCRRCTGCKNGGVTFLFACRTLQFFLIILDPADLCRNDMKLLADKQVSHVYHRCVTVRAEPHLFRDYTVYPFNGQGFIQSLTYRFGLWRTGVCFHFRWSGRLCFQFFIRCPVCFGKFLAGNAKQFPFLFLFLL